MKKTTMVVILMTIICNGVVASQEGVALTNVALKEEVVPGVQANAEVSFMSACVIRGQVINDEPVTQPFLSLGKNGLSFIVWGNFNLTDRITKAREFNEIDLTVQYLLPVKEVEISFGLTEYTYPNKTFFDFKNEDGSVETCETTMKETREVFVQVKYPNAIVVPSVATYYDFDEANGAYAVASLAKDIKLFDKLVLTPSVSTGYGTGKFNSYYFCTDKSAFSNGSADTVLKYSMGNWYALGRLSYTWLWDGDIRDSAKQIYFADNLVYGGVTLGYNF